jgi:hypothetical protein
MYDFSMNPALNLSAFLLSDKLFLTGGRRLRGRVGGQSSDSPEFSTPPCPLPQSRTDRSTRRDIYHTAKKFGFMYFQKRNCARPLRPNFHIHVSVSDLNRHQDRIHRKGNKLERRPLLFAVVFFGSILLPFHTACRLYVLYLLRREINNGYYGYTFLPPVSGKPSMKHR